MALPLAPAVAALGGRMAASKGAGAGAGLIGEKTIKSYGGSMLKTGKLPWDKMAKDTDMLLKVVEKISKTTSKILNTLAKASPALQQQIVILSKSLMLFLRPFGDLMAKNLRVIASGILKLAMKWNDIAGWVFGTAGGDLDKADLKKSLTEERDIAAEEGRMGDVARLDTQIAELENTLLNRLKRPVKFIADFLLSLPEKWAKLKTWVSDIWNAYIVPGFKAIVNWHADIWNYFIVPGFRAIVNWHANIWNNYIVPGFRGILTWYADIWNNYIVPGFKGILTWYIDIWDNYIVPGFRGILTWATKIWDDYIDFGFKAIKNWATKIWDDYIDFGFKAIKNWATNIWDDYIVPGFKGLKNWGSDMWDLIKSAAGRFLGGGEKEVAVGGTIPKTGSYTLHAGERVLTAGQTASTNNSSSTMNITNYFTINASISNDMDINRLAKKLSALNETELRRRVSYG